MKITHFLNPSYSLFLKYSELLSAHQSPSYMYIYIHSPVARSALQCVVAVYCSVFKCFAGCCTSELQNTPILIGERLGRLELHADNRSTGRSCATGEGRGKENSIRMKSNTLNIKSTMCIRDSFYIGLFSYI